MTLFLFCVLLLCVPYHAEYEGAVFFCQYKNCFIQSCIKRYLRNFSSVYLSGKMRWTAQPALTGSCSFECLPSICSEYRGSWLGLAKFCYINCNYLYLDMPAVMRKKLGRSSSFIFCPLFKVKADWVKNISKIFVLEEIKPWCLCF